MWSRHHPSCSQTVFDARLRNLLCRRTAPSFAPEPQREVFSRLARRDVYARAWSARQQSWTVLRHGSHGRIVRPGLFEPGGLIQVGCAHVPFDPTHTLGRAVDARRAPPGKGEPRRASVYLHSMLPKHVHTMPATQSQTHTELDRKLRPSRPL